jgi:hypothetical protein
MPPKRIKAEVEADGSASATPSPSKKAKVSVRQSSRTCPLGSRSRVSLIYQTSWSGDEEALFLDVINSICRKNLWMEAKEHDLLKGRGADGVKRHLDALVRQLPVAVATTWRVYERVMTAIMVRQEAMGWKGWQLVQEARQVIDPAGGAPQRLR